MYIIQSQNRDSNWIQTSSTIYAYRERVEREIVRLQLLDPKSEFWFIELDEMINLKVLKEKTTGKN